MTTVGASLIDGNELTNHMVCKVKVGKLIREYTPWQVKEYGFKDGRIYLAKDLKFPDSTKRVFLEQLVKGKYTLFYYKGEEGKTFFLEQDSTLFIELPKHKSKDDADFRDDLRHYTSDCPKMADAIKLVRYNREGYKKLMSQFEKCKQKPFPFFKFGISAGYSVSKLIPTAIISIAEIKQLKYSYDGGFIAGLFLDSPILLSDISLFVELLYTQHEFSSNKIIRAQDIDFYGKISSLQLPVLIKYSFPSNRIRPFVYVGEVFSYNFNIKDYLYQATIDQNVVEINDMLRTLLIKKVMIGYSIGGGAAVQLYPRNWVSLEIRYNGSYAIDSDQSMKISEIQIATGLSF